MAGVASSLDIVNLFHLISLSLTRKLILSTSFVELMFTLVWL